MSLINKSFKNLETGEVHKIIDSYQNLAITEKREKLDVNRLMDPHYYSEYNDIVLTESKSSYLDHIDPKSFFNDPKMYSVFAEKIKNIDLSKIPDEENVSFSVDMNDSSSISPVTNESAIIITEQESEIEELKRKYGAVEQIQNNNDIIQQNEAFAKILEDDEEEYQVETHQNVHYTFDQTGMSVDVPLSKQVIDKKVEVIDPIITMFKNVKRNTDFSFDIKIDGKIPRLDFIEMMEDSYDTSIIDFLANEFTESIFLDKESLKLKISNEIKSIVYKTKKSISVVEVKNETTIKKRTYKKRKVEENSTKKDKITSK